MGIRLGFAMKYRLGSIIGRIIILFVMLSCTLNAVSQPISFPRFLQSKSVAEIAAKTKTFPADDATLDVAPKKMTLEFPRPVKLVKLTLHNEQRDWVEINFRYTPANGEYYGWDLPTLAPAAYYTADWAILSDNDTLVYGSFSFSFGSEAQSPSVVKAAEEELLLQRYGDPTIRYVPPPRTQIIIDQDPPEFDPPFTIELRSASDN